MYVRCWVSVLTATHEMAAVLLQLQRQFISKDRLVSLPMQALPIVSIPASCQLLC